MDYVPLDYVPLDYVPLEYVEGLPRAFQRQLLAYMLACRPQEACGFIYQTRQKHWQFQPCRNIAGNPETHFEVPAQDWLAVQHHPGLALFHSHPAGPCWPSFLDMQSYLETPHIPWLIVGADDSENWRFFWLGGNHHYDLHARIYRHGTTDCYGLIRDWYRLEKDIHLPDFARLWGWWQSGGNLYAQSFQQAGFHWCDPSDTRQIGDVFFARIRSEVVNHAGLYLGRGLMFHHLSGAYGLDDRRQPKIEPITRWDRFIDGWLRHHQL
ncbi:MAG: NlpC/P60 family protein [Candidatus Puniceispirillaceae bacterium]